MQLLLWVIRNAKKQGFILCLLSILLCWSVLARAQRSGSAVNYEATDVKAETVLKEIERQTGYSLTYNHDEIEGLTIRHVSWKGAAVADVLKELQSKYGLHYSISGDNIALKRVTVKPAVKVSDAGRVTGKISDEETGEVLSGVTIKIGGEYAASSVDGTYVINLPKGRYTAEISSVGYGTKKIESIVINNEAFFELNVSLKKERGTLKGVVVTTDARRETTAALYVRQKNSAVISDGISAEQISRTPDKNVGESLKRVTGLSTLDNRFLVVRGLSERYNGAMLNGQLMPSTELNRKNFSFDLIPTSMVENITVIKTLTPDLSAEFGGGLVEVNTIDIPSRNFLTVTAGGGFNDNTAGKPFLSMQLEGREYLGSVSKHRYLFGSLDWKTGYDAARYYTQHGSNGALFNNNWGITKMKPQMNQNYQVSFGHAMKLANGGDLGIVAAASYRNNFNRVDVNTSRDGWSSKTASTTLGADAKRYDFTTNLGAMVGVGYRRGNHRLSFRSLYIRTLNQQLAVIYSGNGLTAQNWGMNDITTQSTLWQNQVKGEHQLSKQGLKINWTGGYIHLNKLRPDNHVLQAFVDSSSLTADNNNVLIREPANLYEFNRFWSRALEKNYNWDISLSVPFQLAGSKQVFKGGYAGWYKDRLFYVLNTASGSKGGNGLAVPLASVFGPDYTLGTMFSKWGDSMHKTQTLHALYGMFDNRLGTRWRLVWGARAEYVDMGKLNGYLDHQESESGSDLSNWRRREKNWHLFPSANLTYSLTSQMNLRFSYSRSIIRPDLRELSFFHEYDYELGGEYGGAYVRSTVLDNFDFRYEWYPALGDVISVTGFYKNIHYPLEIYQQPNRLFLLKNAKEARNYGVEAEARKSLAFTQVPVIRNLTLYGNFTYLDGKVRPMDITAVPDPNDPLKTSPSELLYGWEKRPQVGAGTYIFNAGIFYDTKLFSLSVLYNSLTNRLARVLDRSGGVSSAYASFYERPAKTLDAQLAVHLLHRRLDVKMNVANLLNSYYIMYSNRDQPDANNNLTKKQMEYKEGLDVVDYKAVVGRTYSFTITYSFR